MKTGGFGPVGRAGLVMLCLLAAANCPGEEPSPVRRFVTAASPTVWTLDNPSSAGLPVDSVRIVAGTSVDNPDQSQPNTAGHEGAVVSDRPLTVSFVPQFSGPHTRVDFYVREPGEEEFSVFLKNGNVERGGWWSKLRAVRAGWIGVPLPSTGEMLKAGSTYRYEIRVVKSGGKKTVFATDAQGRPAFRQYYARHLQNLSLALGQESLRIGDQMLTGASLVINADGSGIYCYQDDFSACRGNYDFFETKNPSQPNIAHGRLWLGGPPLTYRFNLVYPFTPSVGRANSLDCRVCVYEKGSARFELSSDNRIWTVIGDCPTVEYRNFSFPVPASFDGARVLYLRISGNASAVDSLDISWRLDTSSAPKLTLQSGGNTVTYRDDEMSSHQAEIEITCRGLNQAEKENVVNLIRGLP